jgi:hypothetical protein
MDRARDYDVDPKRAESFYASVRTYFPALPDNSLVPDYCGIRPEATVARASLRRISSSMARPLTACRGWCRCSGSSRPGSLGALDRRGCRGSNQLMF